MSQTKEIPRTQWPVMWVVFGAGIIAAMHLGKLPPALPEIRADLQVDLVIGGWIASMISLTGFALGLIAGTLADKLGQRRVLITGLLVLCVGTFMGAAATTGSLMLFSRFVEGLGFTAVTVTGVGMITHVTSPRDRKWALGIWSSYLPLGFSGILVGAAIVLQNYDWQFLWILSAGLTLTWTLIVVLVTKNWIPQTGEGAESRSMISSVIQCVSVPGTILAAACFGLYAAQHISIMAWLPTYLTEEYGYSNLPAAAIPAIVLLFNAGGNWLSALWMGRGVKIWVLLTIGAIGMGCTQIGIFSANIPDVMRLVCAMFYGIFGGMIPAAALASVSIYAPSASHIGTTSGVIVMGTNTGMLFGPPAIGAVRMATGNWNDVIWLVTALAILGALCGLASRRTERRARPYKT